MINLLQKTIFFFNYIVICYKRFFKKLQGKFLKNLSLLSQNRRNKKDYLTFLLKNLSKKPARSSLTCMKLAYVCLNLFNL